MKSSKFVFYHGLAYAGPFSNDEAAQQAVFTILEGDSAHTVVIMTLDQIKKARNLPNIPMRNVYQYILDVFGETNG